MSERPCPYCQDLEDVLREKNELEARIERVTEAAEELLVVAELRGDNQLPHPCDDPVTWTARMQDAWDTLALVLHGEDS